MGFLGIAFTMFIHLFTLASLSSFGVPYLTPYAPRSKKNNENMFFNMPIWKKEQRPDFLNTKKKSMASNISMDWRKSNG